MKFTLSWLKDHLDTQASLAQIVDTLTRIGLEVEDTVAKYADFVVGVVVEAKQHPNADRLKVCVVEAGKGPIQVVCGAPNARTGMKSVFSPVGTYIPGKQITLAKGVIRGVESNGMLCSAAELELSNDHDGIMELPDDAPVGVPYARWAGLDDPVIDVALTPNRPDATGVSGIARDLAAAGLGTLKTPKPKTFESAFDCPTEVRLDFASADTRLCPAFALRLVRGVTNGPSPEWMQRRLSAIGLRPISALVDVTNYLTFDRGRPLHVYDLAKVHGDLTVRRARQGESELALDGRTYALDESMVVIADAEGADSIAGVMGGERSGCDETTRDVLIESALWDPTNIAQTGRKLGIATDARYRFERGVDPDFCVPGCDLATELVLSICGGEPSRMIVTGDPSAPRRTIPFPYTEVKRLIGVDIPRAEGEAILARLGFGVEEGKVLVPSWRPVVQVKADVVEQIIRIAGLDRAPMAPLPRLEAGVTPAVLTLLQKRTRLAKRTLASLGLREAVTWSLISKKAAELFGGGQPSLALANPIAADLSDMRPSLVPGLVAAAERNARRALADVALFEVGQIFLGPGDDEQRIAAAAVRRGLAKSSGEGRHWSGNGPVDAFDAKEDAMALLSALGADNAVQVVPGGPEFLHPGRLATLQFGPKTVVGWFGQIHPSVCDALDAEGPIVAFEIVLDAIPAAKAKPTKAKPKLDRSDFMPVERDLAFVVADSVRAGDILKAAKSAERALVSDIGVFDVYQGKGLPEGTKSIAIAVTLQPRERTLTDAEIEAAVSRIVAEVAKKTGATLRA
ncbi:phenylalanine--tRNA ligase subunit beta [Roseiarcus sp.]|uniref:phenylalanine--tRNA ligase subunit beta n=1 Tax=Roseiarcus sp. TaxID=1969460 RepID=UPI003F97947F